MGVPKFYRWLSERYPLVNQAIDDGIRPEFDCLYLDMNGIIHTATHGPGTDPAKPLAEDVAMSNVFKYIDKVVRLGQPKRLLYMCLDGVAPRAKMNQQRQRRFRAAQEGANVKKEAVGRGEISSSAQLFDSNCITPGTTLMDHLTTHLKFFIRKKIQEDPLWKSISVLFSGHEVPGEAEHKISRYIRNSRKLEGYDPNTRHLLYGLDADLIFLSLATHEPHFALLREEVVFGPSKSQGDVRQTIVKVDQFQLLHISILRDYIENEFRGVEIAFEYNLERIVDDWIFLSFFVGNDFIPHLPSMDIHLGCLDKLIALYKSLLKVFNGYLTDCGLINFPALEIILRRLAETEDEVFALQKAEEEKLDRRSRPRRKNRESTVVDRLPTFDPSIDVTLENDDSDVDADLNDALSMLELSNGSATAFKEDYYSQKWPDGQMQISHERFQLFRSYLEGLQWVLLYYYHGVPSWNWFYPYFYAPLASSLVNLTQYLPIEFVLGQPFLPFEQLLGVLPASSGHLIPSPLANLMSDPQSLIIDFYPSEFDVDMNGKKNEWEGIALIPFVDQNRLIDAVKSIPPNSFTSDELRRNRHDTDLTFKFDASISEVVNSTIPQLFSTLRQSNCRVSKCIPPPEPPVYRSELLEECVLPAPTFPYVPSLELTMALSPVAVNVFGRPSKKESLVTILTPQLSWSIDNARHMLSKICVVEWPFFRDAEVISVVDSSKCFTKDSPEKPYLLTSLQSAQFCKDAENDRTAMLCSRAVDIGPVTVRVEVCLFNAMDRGHDGSIHKVFHQDSIFVPMQLVLLAHPNPDKRFVAKPPASILDAFPIGMNVIYIGSPPSHFGQLAVVEAHNSKKAATIRLLTLPDESTQMKNLQSIRETDKWTISYRAAQLLHMSPLVLARVSSAVQASPGRVSVGLNLKFVKRQLMVPGYTRIGSAWGDNRAGGSGQRDVWEYSDQAIQLIADYQKEFPEIFDAIENSSSSERMLNLSEFVQRDVKSYLERITVWMKKQESFSLPLVSTTSETLSKSSVQRIEEVQAEIITLSAPVSEVLMKNVPMEFLYKQAPHVQWSPSELVTPRLGDRVLFLGGHHGVPFGTRGNLVGIHEEALEVVFDVPILSGTDLHGRCLPSRGLCLDRKCLLSLSQPRIPKINKDRQRGQRAGKPATDRQLSVNTESSEQVMSPIVAVDSRRAAFAAIRRAEKPVAILQSTKPSGVSPNASTLQQHRTSQQNISKNAHQQALNHETKAKNLLYPIEQASLPQQVFSFDNQNQPGPHRGRLRQESANWRSPPPPPIASPVTDYAAIWNRILSQNEHIVRRSHNQPPPVSSEEVSEMVRRQFAIMNARHFEQDSGPVASSLDRQSSQESQRHPRQQQHQRPPKPRKARPQSNNDSAAHRPFMSYDLSFNH